MFAYRFIVLFVNYSPSSGLISSVLGKRLVGKSVPTMAYLVSGETLNLNLVNQFRLSEVPY